MLQWNAIGCSVSGILVIGENVSHTVQARSEPLSRGGSAIRKADLILLTDKVDFICYVMRFPTQ